MKQDLDRLMKERGLDAMMVSGKLVGNPVLRYMINGASVIKGFVVKKRGQEALFICFPIDREEASRSGLRVVTTNHYDYEGILKEFPDPLGSLIELYRRIFTEQGISGRVGFYGMLDQGVAWETLQKIQEKIDVITVCGEYEPTLVDVARATKDPDEVNIIREVGHRSCSLMGEIVEFLRSHRVKGGMLVQKDDTPLTIGRVHKEIAQLLMENHLEVPEGVIFSIGRDAGVPHNKGNMDDPLELGKTIIFDLAPRQVGGGYYFDMTRTFCLGFAPPEVEKAYQDVKGCLQTLLDSYTVGDSVRKYQRMAFDYFEARGHPTLGSDTKAESGFVTGLGHGIGLAVHEWPFYTDQPSNKNIIQIGNIFTCEPGLYYPERGYGIRIEDVVWIDPTGAVQNLCDFPKELVIPVK